ncbi:restriction endonuclease subunit S [Aurantibacter sp.]|uniref:restriction endonuclease subunit S n=1 Tax=Aurantibacter sp. TaxID=2807103 RepID=UPI0032668312
MKTYETYKESGVNWIGKIPKKWETIKIKFLDNSDQTLFLDGDWIESKVIEEDGIRYLTTGNIGPGYYKEQGRGFISDETFGKLNCTEVFPGDLVASRLNKPIGRACIIPDLGYRIVVAVDNVIIRPRNEFDTKYLMYVMNDVGYSDYTDLISRGATMQRISRGQLGRIIIPAPQKKEQTQIANYLDHKTQIIDTLIEKKEQLIKKLQAQRQAIINDAVTKGLNPDVKMKDSGIEWLGEIPEHWEVVKLKYLATISRGAILRPVDDPNYFDENGKWSYLNISDATKCDKYLDKAKLRLSELGSNKSARVEPNNLIMTASATIGKMFINRIPVCVHDGFIPITALKCSIDFLYHYLGNPQLYVAIGKSNTQKNIYLDEVKNMIISLPPREEQETIYKFLESHNKDYTVLIKKAKSQIKKLKTYRQSIISEAVTGKIDVRDWQAPTKNA